MPLGILLNRLSRPKEGETPEQQLQKGRVILLEEMLPVIQPDAVADRDYLYKEDIISRLKSHREGELLRWAMTEIRRGRVAWVAVTEIARLSGDMEAFGEFIGLCQEHRVRVYTRQRIRYPYEPWKADSLKDLAVEEFLSRMEMLSFLSRVERKRDSSYPIDAATGEKRLTTFEGIGRHLNGRVPTGYLWDPRDKKVLPAKRIPEDIPAPDYIPPDRDTPPAYTWFEIVRIAREVGRTYGVVEASRRIYRETGVLLLSGLLQDIWRNPFYAGRPTLTREMRGRRLMRREQPLSTTGHYPPVDTWEEHLLLQAAVANRASGNVRTASDKWASGLLRCACGEHFISQGQMYRCAGYQHHMAERRADRERTVHGLPRSSINPGTSQGWQRTPTCGSIEVNRVHEHIEKALTRYFRSSLLPARIARMKARAETANPDHDAMRRQEAQIQADLTRNREAMKRARDYATRGLFTEREFTEQKDTLTGERAALESRLARVREDLSTPVATPAAAHLIETFLTVGFPVVWEEAEPQEKATLARLLIDHVPVTGGMGKGNRDLGAPVWRWK